MAPNQQQKERESMNLDPYPTESLRAMTTTNKCRFFEQNAVCPRGEPRRRCLWLRSLSSLHGCKRGLISAGSTTDVCGVGVPGLQDSVSSLHYAEPASWLLQDGDVSVGSVPTSYLALQREVWDCKDLSQRLQSSVLPKSCCLDFR